MIEYRRNGEKEDPIVIHIILFILVFGAGIFLMILSYNIFNGNIGGNQDNLRLSTFMGWISIMLGGVALIASYVVARGIYDRI